MGQLGDSDVASKLIELRRAYEGSPNEHQRLRANIVVGDRPSGGQKPRGTALHVDLDESIGSRRLNDRDNAATVARPLEAAAPKAFETHAGHHLPGDPAADVHDPDVVHKLRERLVRGPTGAVRELPSVGRYHRVRIRRRIAFGEINRRPRAVDGTAPDIEIVTPRFAAASDQGAEEHEVAVR
ncbi:MAG: hypothetical protein WBE91_12150 [Steroidobacteraceae bacterium]